MVAADVVVIPQRFNGPPGVGNGGYVCGLLAAHVEGDAEVTLRRPAPLGSSLEITTVGDGGILLMHGTELVAEALPRSVELTMPAPVDVFEATSATDDCPGFTIHLGLDLPVLGRQATRIVSALRSGHRCVAVGWPIGRDGRKGHAGAALFSESGEVLATSRLTCIEPRRDPQ